MNNERYEFKSIAPPKKKGSKEKKYGLIVILLLLVLLLGVIAFAAIQARQAFLSRSATHFVDVPVVETHLVSADGNMHMFGARVVIELDNDAPSVHQDVLYNAVLAAVSSLSYEDIVDYYGMETLRNAVRARLSSSFSNEDLLGVYFAQFLSDMPLPNLEADRVPGRNPMLDVFLGN